MINVTNVSDFTPTIEYTKITRNKQNSRISNNNYQIGGIYYGRQ